MPDCFGPDLPLSRARRGGVSLLAAAGVPDPASDARLLLAHAAGLEPKELARAELMGEIISVSAAERYADLIDRRRRRIPLQHITGTAFFRHLELDVGPGVFVPRPETELAIDHVAGALAPTGGPERPLVVDLGTGSGAIAISLAVELAGVDVVGVESSSEALAYTRANVRRYTAAIAAAGNSIELVHGDAGVVDALRPQLSGRADVVVANPPYVPPNAVPVDPEVAVHDPDLALYGGGSDGLEVPARFVAAAYRLLRSGGYVVLEHGEDQGLRMRRLLAGSGFERPGTFADYTGRDRFTGGTREQETDAETL